MIMRRKQGNIILITLKNNQGSYTFLNKKFKDFSRTHFPLFKDSIQCKKRTLSLYFLFLDNMSNFILKAFQSVFAPS